MMDVPLRAAETEPIQIGPYRVVDVLGRGGMGVVYRGQHVVTSELVAVKTLEAVDAVRLAGLRREIDALAQVRHPGIVSIVGQGVTGGVPWYAMELLAGRTLRDEMKAGLPAHAARVAQTTRSNSARATAPTTSFDDAPVTHTFARTDPCFRRVTRILYRVCSALSHLHAAGFVHRDLKPENIFVRPNGLPVLVDFGICGRFAGTQARETLDLPDGRYGTEGYSAPEQSRGALVDARADLYALGCILYESITGLLPAGDTDSHTRSILHGQRAYPPSYLAAGVPAELDRVTALLLERNPQNRLGYAEDLARLLRPLLDLPDEPAETAPSTGPYLYRPEFVGREQTVQELQRALRELSEQGRGSGAFLCGESGVGKTRLALEVVHEARRHGAQVVLSQCVKLDLTTRATNDSAPLAAFAPALLAIADRCQRGSPSDMERLLGEHTKLLASYQPRLCELAGYDQLAESPVVVPREARTRALSQVVKALRAMAEEAPLVLAIDDLQWADEMSLELLAMLIDRQTAAQHRVFVLGTFRSEEATSTLHSALTGASIYPLERFNDDEVSGMVRGMLALDAAPSSLVAFLLQRCGGNPVFVVEYLRSAIAEGVLTRPRGVWQLGPRADMLHSESAMAVPAQLKSVVQGRLSQLDATCRRLVEAAAVLGRNFEVALLCSCAALPSSDAATALRTLQQRHIIEELDDGRLRFVHDVIRESAYDSLTRERRRRLHQRAGELVEQETTTDASMTHIAALHFSNAGLAARAARHFLSAAALATNSFAHERALELYALARAELDSIEPSARAADWAMQASMAQELAADLFTLSARRQEARAMYAGAASNATGHIRVSARIQRKLGKNWELDKQYDQGIAAYRAAETMLEAASARDEGWWREWLEIQMGYTWSLYWTADVSTMALVIERAREPAELHGTQAQLAQLYMACSLMRTREERYRLSPETVEYARRAVAAALASGDRSQLAAMRFGLGFALLFGGDVMEAERVLRSSVVEAERIGDRALHARSTTYLMLAVRKRGDVAQTLMMAKQSADVAESAQMKDYIGAAQANQGWSLVLECKYQQAESLLEQALAHWRSPPAVYPFEWMALFPLLRLHAEQGALESCSMDIHGLLQPTQERLPEPLSEALEQAAASEPRQRSDAVGRALAVASAHGYL